MNIIAVVLISFGLFFFFVGTIGVIRFPDALTRAHGAAKCDTLGAVLSLLGLIVLKGFSPSSIKLLMVIIFLWIANPTATHMIARAILASSGRENKTLGESKDANKTELTIEEAGEVK
ncbi:monovalent cation/H(+) antiporter subunit G [Helicovermis profundi]|uniref:Monovalent cation/H(+) antiporter subunit G n=1 Tax=Helicovermis profundi TaxID=3065157 RepID=A0AAU9EM50_9FIRM|nr:hypothetical protein HLPR_06720 [Clostridia bacterium S502]